MNFGNETQIDMTDVPPGEKTVTIVRKFKQLLDDNNIDHIIIHSGSETSLGFSMGDPDWWFADDADPTSLISPDDFLETSNDEITISVSQE